MPLCCKPTPDMATPGDVAVSHLHRTWTSMTLLHSRAEAQEQILSLYFADIHCYGRCSSSYVAYIMLL
jgi:hypothetical protein